jgi:hypothetical protein
MISSLKTVGGSCGAYIGAIGARQATRQTALPRPGRDGSWIYDNFIKVNPFCNQHPGFVQLAANRF